MSSIRIGTWNILGRRVFGTRLAAEPGAVSAIIAENPVDVLCLQEVHFFGDEPDPQLVAELKACGLAHFIGVPLSPSHLDPSAQLGVGVASTKPLRHVGEFRPTNPELRANVRGENWVLHDKGMVGCEVMLPDAQQVCVYSLHMFPFHEFGVREDDDRVDEMWREFWGYADQAVDSKMLILAGDFNHERRTYAAERWSSNTWQFCFLDQATTAKGLALDEIALSWMPRTSRTYLVETFSDHYLAILDTCVDGVAA